MQRSDSFLKQKISVKNHQFHSFFFATPSPSRDPSFSMGLGPKSTWGTAVKALGSETQLWGACSIYQLKEVGPFSGSCFPLFLENPKENRTSNRKKNCRLFSEATSYAWLPCQKDLKNPSVRPGMSMFFGKTPTLPLSLAFTNTLCGPYRSKVVKREGLQEWGQSLGRLTSGEVSKSLFASLFGGIAKVVSH